MGSGECSFCEDEMTSLKDDVIMERMSKILEVNDMSELLSERSF